MKCPHCGSSVKFLKAFLLTNRWKHYQCSDRDKLSNWKIGNLIFLFCVSWFFGLFAKLIVMEISLAAIGLQVVVQLIALLVLCYFFGKFERISKAE